MLRMSFSKIISALQEQLRSNLPQIRILLKKNPALSFTVINDIASSVGKKYNVKLSLNFPERGKIEKFELYGTENVGIVFQRDSRTFPIARDVIRTKALESFGTVQVQDAYMYEGKEGVRIIGEGYRLDILPASLHVWGEINDSIRKFCDWLLENCYEIRPGVDGALSETNS